MSGILPSISLIKVFSNLSTAGIVNTVAGSTTTGISGSELDVTTGAATVALPIKAIDISLDPDNDDTSSANTNVLVVINNHVYGHVTAGLT